jgi:peptidyl-prolyl cis-trans isomerase B (cyclophilin B)
LPTPCRRAARNQKSFRDFVPALWQSLTRMKRFLLICLSLMATWGAWAAESAGAAKPKEAAVLQTSEGELVIELWLDAAPNTVENFKKLAKQGFYDGTAFHRIISGFMIQGGDPNTKDPAKEAKFGQGGPGYKIKGEVNGRPHVRGVISMANSGHPDTAGSQFFICLDAAPHLNRGYTAFGKVVKGDSVLTKLGAIPVTSNAQGERSKPTRRVELTSVKIAPLDDVR